jgi:hypothetical protein
MQISEPVLNQGFASGLPWGWFEVLGGPVTDKEQVVAEPM